MENIPLAAKGIGISLCRAEDVNWVIRSKIL